MSFWSLNDSILSSFCGLMTSNSLRGPGIQMFLWMLFFTKCSRSPPPLHPQTLPVRPQIAFRGLGGHFWSHNHIMRLKFICFYASLAFWELLWHNVIKISTTSCCIPRIMSVAPTEKRSITCPLVKMTHIWAKSMSIIICLIYDSFSVMSLNPLIFDQYELRKRFTSVKLSKKSISGVNFDIWCLRNRIKWGRRCHCNRFFVTVSRGVLLVMNRGLPKLSL